MLCQILGLSKEYVQGERIVPVDSIDFNLDAGDFVAIVGESGIGKSTFLMLLAGIMRPTSGSIVFEDRDITTLTDDEQSAIRRSKVGYLFQSSHLVKALTVEENILFSAQLVTDEASAQTLTAQLIADLGLEDRKTYFPHQLSGGQKRRTMIASTLARQPKIILADEPTNDLDEQWSARVMELLRSYAEAGNAVVMVTHDRDNVAYASRTYRFRDGKLNEFDN